MQVIFWVQNRGRGKMISGGWRAEGIGHNWHRKSEEYVENSDEHTEIIEITKLHGSYQSIRGKEEEEGESLTRRIINLSHY